MNNRRVLTLIFGIFLMMPMQSYSCACCSSPNTFYEYDQAFPEADGAKLEGKMGLNIYGGKGEADIDVGNGDISGEVRNGLVKLTLVREGKSLGTLTLRPAGKATYRKTGLDFILPPESVAGLALKDNSSIYHQVTVNVTVEPDEELEKNLDTSLLPYGVLTFHGNSNSCWDPREHGGRWTFEYSVKKGETTERGMGRGRLVAG